MYSRMRFAIFVQLHYSLLSHINTQSIRNHQNLFMHTVAWPSISCFVCARFISPKVTIHTYMYIFDFTRVSIRIPNLLIFFFLILFFIMLSASFAFSFYFFSGFINKSVFYCSLAVMEVVNTKCRYFLLLHSPPMTMKHYRYLFTLLLCTLIVPVFQDLL